MSEKKRTKSRSFIFYGIYFVLILIFAFSSYRLISYFAESKKGKNFNEDLLSQVLVSPPKDENSATDFGENPTSEPLPEDEIKASLYPDIDIDFEKVRSLYKDCVAWIYCPGTCINYPVMQGSDNDYYLHKLPDGTDHFAGSIFMDFQDQSDLSGFTTTVYGHNLNDQTMFTPILKYRKDGFFEEHPYFFYFTGDQLYRLEVFAGVNTTATSELYKRPASLEEFNSYISSVFRKSAFISDVRVSSEDKVMLLSTCSGGAGQKYRFILYCKIVPIEY